MRLVAVMNKSTQGVYSMTNERLESFQKTLNEAKSNHEIALQKANESLSKSPIDYEGYNDAMVMVEKAEKDCKTFAEKTFYEQFSNSETPLLDVIKAFTYPIVSHKFTKSQDKENPRIISVDYVERYRQVNLLKFCKQLELNCDWQYNAMALNQLLALRTAKEIGYTESQINSLCKSYFLQQKAKEIKMGGTPTSNTQTCKLLQSVIDAILPEINDDGTPKYKCINKDVKYLDNAYTKMGSDPLTIVVSKDSFLIKILANIVYRLVTDKEYIEKGYRENKAK